MEIPEHLRPGEFKPTNVQVIDVEPSKGNPPVQIGSQDDVFKISQEMSLIQIPAQLVGLLGASMAGAGVVRIANNLALVTQSQLVTVLLKLAHDALESSPTQREKTARTLGYLANAIDKQNRTLKVNSQPEKTSQHSGGNRLPWGGLHKHTHFHIEKPEAEPQP